MTDPTPTVTATHDAFDDPDMGRGGPADSAEPVVEDVEPTPAPDPAPTVGTVTLNWEVEHVSNRLFIYQATVCTIDDGHVLVEGTGVEDGTDNPSTLQISAVPDVLEHPGTGTYLAEGHVTVTVDDTELVGDGRIYTSPEGFHGPSMFHYRFDEGYAEFRTLWWIGDDHSGAGAVTVNCDA